MSAKSSVLWTWKATTKSPGGVLSFDAVMSETYEESSTLTDFPVESGANITDHIRDQPKKISFEVLVTDTPHVADNRVNPDAGPRGALVSVPLDIPAAPTQRNFLGLARLALGALGLRGKKDSSATLLKFTSEFSAISDTLEVLSKLRKEGRLIDVVSRDWFAEGMVIESISKPRRADDGMSSTFNVNLKQIRIVETRQTVAAVPAEPRAKGKVDAGKKDGTDASGKKKQSLTYQLLGKIGAPGF